MFIQNGKQIKIFSFYLKCQVMVMVLIMHVLCVRHMNHTDTHIQIMRIISDFIKIPGELKLNWHEIKKNTFNRRLTDVEWIYNNFDWIFLNKYEQRERVKSKMVNDGAVNQFVPVCNASSRHTHSFIHQSIDWQAYLNCLLFVHFQQKTSIRTIFIYLNGNFR